MRHSKTTLLSNGRPRISPGKAEAFCSGEVWPRTILTLPLMIFLLMVLWVGVVVAAPIPGVTIGTASFVGMSEIGPLDTPTLVTSYGDFLTVFGGSTDGLANPYLAPSVAGFFVNGGQRLYVVRVSTGDDASLIGVDGGPGLRTGLQSLLDIDEISIVAIPGSSSQTVQTAMIVHCENTGDRMALLDPALTADVAAVLDQRAGLGSADGFAALYFPWVQAAPAGELLWLPPSGLVAGIHASHDPPDSPVGPIATAIAVSVTVTDSDQDLLNPQGINVIRFFSGQGILAWGARTIATNSEWIYIALRRIKLFLEESIAEGTAWARSEPNDPTLWAVLQSDINYFLHGRYLEGWFQGTQAEDAYFARCDATTMTQHDLDQGLTIMLIAYSPLRPAEFVVFQVVQSRFLFADGFESGNLNAWSD